MIHPIKRGRAAAWLLSVFAGLGFAGQALADGCQPISPTTDLSTILTPLGANLLTAQDLCYAEGLHWKETNGRGGNVTLYQRFDYYRPTSAPLTQAIPLVIWAHPNGQTENLNATRMKRLVAPAIGAGFAFMSIEFRHPVGSQLSPPAPVDLHVPHTDIARAVQWARARAGVLGIDTSNIFIVGQSRGSLGVLTALMPDQADAGSPVDYLRQSSRVNAVFAAQAQTTYEHAEVRNTFIVSSDWAKFDSPDLGYPFYVDPGSAIAQVSDDDPPIALRYERAPTDSALKRVVPLPMLEPDGSCAAADQVAGCFDEHHPNFGLALKLAYDARPALTRKMSVQYLVPEDSYFDRYMCFFIANLTPAAQAQQAASGLACSP